MTKLLVADDHPLFIEGLSVLLQASIPNIDIIQVPDFESVEYQMGLTPFNLVLLDRIMPGMFGMARVPELKRSYPTIPIAVISASESSQHIREALEAGAIGFIPKTSEPQVIIKAIKGMLSGVPYVPQQAWEIKPNLQQVPADMQISERQAEIVKCLSRGMSNKIIAAELGLSEGTVKQHINKLFKTLKVTNRTQAIQVARDLGLIQ